MYRWVLIVVLGCILIALVVTAIKQLFDTAEEETEDIPLTDRRFDRLTIFILCLAGAAGCGFTIKYFATQLLSR